MFFLLAMRMIEAFNVEAKAGKLSVTIKQIIKDCCSYIYISKNCRVVLYVVQDKFLSILIIIIIIIIILIIIIIIIIRPWQALKTRPMRSCGSWTWIMSSPCSFNNNNNNNNLYKAMASTEDKAYEIMRELDVDYVLVIFGGLTGYSSDGENRT
jgi:hypothetical protein